MKKGLFFCLLMLSIELSADIKSTINLSGKERMLTQKMSKEALLIARGINIESNRKELRESVELFDRILNGLYSGDKKLNLSKTTDQEILKKLDKIKREWKLFREDILKVADGKVDKKLLESIDKRNVKLLNMANEVVEMYRDKSKIEPQLAQTINLAGKERMLSQKMAKELLLIANNLKSDKNINSLKSSGEHFTKTLQNLMKNRDAIDKELLERVTKVQKLWMEYQDKLLNTDFTTESRMETKKKKEEVTEKLTKELLFIANSVDEKIYKKQLRETGEMFNTILNGLIDGNSTLGLPKAKNPKILKELNSAKRIWAKYRPIIYEGNISEEALNQSIKLNSDLLENMERVVQTYCSLDKI